MGVESKTEAAKKQDLAEVEAEARNEIEEIMNEIQNLQQNMADAPNIAVPAPAPRALKAVPSPEEVAPQEDSEISIDDFRGSSEDASMEETLASMKDDGIPSGNLLNSAVENEPEPQEPILSELYAQEEETIPAEPTVAVAPGVDESLTEEIGEQTMVNEENSEGCMSMTLTGNMTLKLKYEYEGQEVTIGFSNHNLMVQLSDGTEFKIPVARVKSAQLKAA